MANRKKIQYWSKTLGVVTEELKQRIEAIAAKFRRYQERVDRFRQNRTFQNRKKFRGDIWNDSLDHNR